jgi:hypothetical protein
VIKRTILEQSNVPGGRLPVYLVSQERADLLGLLTRLTVTPWRAGRIIYYDPIFRGGVDFLIDVDGSRAKACVLRTSRGGDWGGGREFDPSGLLAAVQALQAQYPLKQKAGADPQDAARPSHSVAPPPIPRAAPKPGQMALHLPD